jgi:3',5'-cyclic AMP phosphodiesterase CpdA
MSISKVATFAVISDLHCRLATDSNDSFLTVGGLRSPSSRHPVQALLNLIDGENLKSDALLVPGDLTNKARTEGLQQGWDYSLEIGRKLGVSTVIPVIGNHDIDSHRTNPSLPVFYAVRNLRPEFPFQDDGCVRSFFADGYCVLKAGQAEIIAINTVIDHTDATSAKRGAFGLDRIDRMEACLKGTLTSPLRGALMHHHPVLHSGAFLEDTDVIPTGDALLASLRRLGCRFVIHGHKHFSRLSYVDGIAVLASGSFSAMLHEFGTSVANTFHTVRVEGETPEQVRGQVHTWVFRYGCGWRRSNAEFNGFPFLSGFGRRLSLTDIITGFQTLGASETSRSRFSQDEVLKVVPEAPYLTPAEREQVNDSLGTHDLKIADYDDGRLELWRSFRP